MSRMKIAFALFLLPMAMSCSNPFGKGSTSTPTAPATPASGDFSTTWNCGTGTSSNYAYDATQVQVSGGVCLLKVVSQTDQDQSSLGFGGGTHSGTAWNASLSGLTNAPSLPVGEFPDSAGSGWMNMNGNVLLMHANGAVGSISGGASISDTSGNANHGVALNPGSAGMAFQTGLLNQGIFFDGSDDVIQVPNAPSLNLGAGMTISMWINASDFTGSAGVNPRLMAHSQDASNGFVLAITQAGSSPNSLTFEVNQGGTLTGVAGLDSGMSLHQWIHVAATWNGSQYAIYVNGVPQYTTASTAMSLSAAPDLYVGAKNSSSGFFHGLIDETALWNRALSMDEIQQIYVRQSRNFEVGQFDSRVFSVGGAPSWTSFAWVPGFPTGKELPSKAQNETAYSSQNVNMSGNQLLLHLNGGVGSIANGASIPDSSSSGSSQNGVVINGDGQGMAYQSAKFNQGIYFDGLNDFIEVADAPGVRLGSAMTVSIWMNATSAQQVGGGNPRMIAKSDDSNNGYMLLMGDQAWSNSTAIHFDVYKNGVANAVTTTSSITLNQWHHVVGTWDGVTSLVYFDGVVQPTVAENSGFYRSVQTPLRVGTNESGNGSFNGILDEVAIWSRAFSSAEVSALYGRGAAQLQYQVRSCADSTCASGTFAGPDGTSSTYFSEASSSRLGLPSFPLSNVASLPYFQYRAFLQSTVGTSAQAVSKSVTVGPAHYAASAPTLSNQTGVSYSQLTSFTETLGAGGCAGGVRYLFSKDGVTWYYWNGSAWTRSDGTFTQASAASVISKHLSGFATQVGKGTFKFKAFLNSDSTQACEIDSLVLTGAR